MDFRPTNPGCNIECVKVFPFGFVISNTADVIIIMALILELFLFGIFIVGLVGIERSSAKEITVAFGNRKPFATYQPNGNPKGFDVSIVDNFARKFNLQANYLFVNASLNLIFANESNFQKSTHQDVLR